MASDTQNPSHPTEPFLRQERRPDATRRPAANPPGRAQAMAMITIPSETAIHNLPDEAIIRQLEQWTDFFALAIQIDRTGGGEVPAEHLGTLAAVLTANLQSASSIWFHWQGPLYGCILAQVDAAHARNTAATIQNALAGASKATATIGLARYPLMDYDRLQTLANACKALDHAAFFGPGGSALFDSVSLNISGDRHYQNNDVAAAIAEYEKALALDPCNINVLNSLGVCRADLGDYTAARKCFKAALALTPTESMATYNLGVIQLLQGKPKAALTLFKKAHGHNPDDFQIPYQIGRMLFEQGHLKKAKPYLEQAAALNPLGSGIYSLLGQCLAQEQNIAEAIKALKKAVKSNPSDAAALSNLGCLYDQKGENPDICLAFSRQSVALAPRNGQYRFRLARLYQKHGHPDLALSEYQQAAALGYACRQQIDELDAAGETKEAPASRCA